MLPTLQNAEFRRIHARAFEDPFHFDRISDCFDPETNRFILPDLGDAYDRMMHWAISKDEYHTRYGFAVIDEQAIEALRPLSPILEVGAGIGYWAHELRRAGIDIVATEPELGERNPYPFRVTEPWTMIEKLSAADAIRKYPDRNLLTVWPGYDETWTGEMLKEFTAEFVAYAGESSGGCTGDDDFHSHLDEFFEEIAIIDIPHFRYLNDRLYLYKRK